MIRGEKGMDTFLTDMYSSLSVFFEATGINVLFLDENGKEQVRFGKACEYCELVQQDGGLACKCAEIHRSAGRYAEELGDCYFFTCHANMIHISIAILEGNRYLGSVLAGPLLLEYPDSAALDMVIEACNIPSGCRSILFAAMKDVLLIEPKRIYYIGELLFRLIYNLFSEKNGEMLRKRREKRTQQEMIGVSIQNFKSTDGQRRIQEQQEKELVELVETGEIEKAQVILNDILGGIYFSSGNDIGLIKMRMNELLTVLSRQIIKKGASSDVVYDMIRDFQKNSATSTDLVDISYNLGEVLRGFVEMMKAGISQNVSGAIRESLSYIHRNYREQITLEQVAASVPLSPARFSRLFKAEMGIGFSAYVNRLRLEKAKELLMESDMSLSAVTQYVGYSNQQYFSKVFKEEYRITPGQYRRKERLR